MFLTRTLLAEGYRRSRKAFIFQEQQRKQAGPLQGAFLSVYPAREKLDNTAIGAILHKSRGSQEPRLLRREFGLGVDQENLN